MISTKWREKKNTHIQKKRFMASWGWIDGGTESYFDGPPPLSLSSILFRMHIRMKRERAYNTRQKVVNIDPGSLWATHGNVCCPASAYNRFLLYINLVFHITRGCEFLFYAELPVCDGFSLSIGWCVKQTTSKSNWRFFFLSLSGQKVIRRVDVYVPKNPLVEAKKKHTTTITFPKS